MKKFIKNGKNRVFPNFLAFLVFEKDPFFAINFQYFFLK